MKTVSVKKDESTGEFLIDLKDLEDIVETDRVVYYTINKVGDENNPSAVSVQFYDKDKKIIPLKGG